MQCAIYFGPMNIRLNAESRDYLGDPDYVRFFYENGKIVIEAGKDTDFKVTKCKYLRFTSCAALGKIIDIPQKTKLYGISEGGKIYFPVPKEYQK